MSFLSLVLLAASLAGATDPAEVVREQIRTSLADLEKKVVPLEDLAASYAGDAPAPEPAAREALRAEATSELERLNKAMGEFWPLWDVARFAEGARLLGGAVRGTEKVETGSAFLDDTDIDDFKAEVRRMQDRATRALAREKAAFEAHRLRLESRRRSLLLAAAGGAAFSAALAAYWRWRHTMACLPPS